MVAEKYQLQKPVSGWWQTQALMDMDCADILPPGTEVTVWYSPLRTTYFVCLIAPKCQAFHNDVPTLFIGQVFVPFPPVAKPMTPAEKAIAERNYQAMIHTCNAYHQPKQ